LQVALPAAEHALTDGPGNSNLLGMSSLKQLKQAQKAAGHHQQIILDLSGLVKDIERCEKTITSLQKELLAINSKYEGKRNTREDVEYLSGLLDCAKKKLAWEKQIASLQKRTPELLQQMSRFLNDPLNPPSDEMRQQMLQSLQSVQATMERLQTVKIE
jgi:hypothetical protein